MSSSRCLAVRINGSAVGIFSSAARVYSLAVGWAGLGLAGLGAIVGSVCGGLCMVWVGLGGAGMSWGGSGRAEGWALESVGLGSGRGLLACRLDLDLLSLVWLGLGAYCWAGLGLAGCGG